MVLKTITPQLIFSFFFQISFTLLYIVQLCSCTFDLVCPNISHKKFRMLYVCNTTLQYYTCLKDANKQQYKELCLKENELQAEGLKLN